MIITASISLKSKKFWSPMVSLEQHAALYSLKNVFDFFFMFEQMLSLGDPPCFCDLPPAKPTFLLSTMWSGRRRGCFVFGGSLKTSLFPSKSDAQVKGVTGHMLSSTLAWQLQSSSAYSLLPLSLQNDVLESLLCVWPPWGLFYDSSIFFLIVLIFTYWTWPWATLHRFWACLFLFLKGYYVPL